MEKFLNVIMMFIAYRLLGFESFIVISITLFLYNMFWDKEDKNGKNISE